MPSAVSTGPIATQGDLPPTQPTKAAETAYIPQAGRRRASIGRFAPATRGGAARRIVDVKRCGAARYAASTAKPGASETATEITSGREMAAAPQAVVVKAMPPAGKQAQDAHLKTVPAQPLAYRMSARSVRPPVPPSVAARPVSAPAALFPASDVALPPALPERAVRSAPVGELSPSTPTGGGVAAPIRRVAARLLDAVGFIRAVVHDAYAGRGRAPAKIDISAPSAPLTAPLSVPLTAPLSAPPSAALIKDVAKLIRTDDLLEVMVRFSGADITYDKLLYLAEKRSHRIMVDEAGQGFNAPLGKTDDSLTRRLVSTLQNNDNPWRILAPLGDFKANYPELVVAAERYRAYRDQHYPDFTDIHNRLKGVADLAPVEEIKAHLEAKRAESEAQDIPFDVDAYILDHPLNPASPHPLTARQLSADLLKLQQCTPDMARFLEQLDLADCLQEYRRRQAAGMPAGTPQ